MTWTTTETPHDGDSTGGPHDDALLADLPALPLTGPLAEALTTARTGADDAAHAACFVTSLGPDQRLQALRRAASARDVLDATVLRLTATFTPDEVRALGATSLTDLLLTHTGASPRRAATEVQLAAAVTAPELPLSTPHPDPQTDDDTGSGGATGPAAGSSAVNLARLGAAHACGQVSTDITALALRTVASLPARVRRTHTAAADAHLARLLPGLTHAQAATVCTALAHTLDPDRADRGFDPDDVDRRYLDLTVHADGFVDVRARLDPVTGAELKAAIDHLSKPDPTTTAPLADHPTDQSSGADQQEPLPGLGADSADSADSDSGPASLGSGAEGVAVRDPRTAGQRRADALALLVRTGRAGDLTRGGEGARVIVTTTQDALGSQRGAEPAHCETTGRALSTAALRTLACAGSLQAVVLSARGAQAEVLSLGRAVRLFTAGQRRAMLARDGGCAIPGCTAPPGWLEAHHVHEWAAGGPTDVASGVLLCTRHHVLVTLGVWQVRMRGGVPQVRPPRSIDPLRRWLLNPRRRLQERTVTAVRTTTTPGGPPAHPTDPPDPPDPPDVPDIPSPHGTCAC